MNISLPQTLLVPIANALGVWHKDSDFDKIFRAVGVAGTPANTSGTARCLAWLTQGLSQTEIDSLDLLGAAIRQVMDMQPPEGTQSLQIRRLQKQVIEALGKHGLKYVRQGKVRPEFTDDPIEGLRRLLRVYGFDALEQYMCVGVTKNTDNAITSACSFLEALFKTYIVREGLGHTPMASLMDLWKIVRGHLFRHAEHLEESKHIINALVSIVAAVGDLRNRYGTAHGQAAPSQVEERDARLAVHSAYSVSIFCLEAWASRSKALSQKATAAKNTETQRG